MLKNQLPQKNPHQSHDPKICLTCLEARITKCTRKQGKDQASGDQLADTHLPSYTQNNLQPQLSNLNPLPSPMNFLSSPEQKPQQASQVSSANQLLGLLHKMVPKEISITSPNELWGTSTPGSTGAQRWRGQ